MSVESTPRGPRVRHLVLDSGPIIKGHGLNLHLIAEVSCRSFCPASEPHAFLKNIYTVPEVIQEIRDSKARDILDRMPFLQIRQPSDQAMKAGSVFGAQL